VSARTRAGAGFLTGSEVAGLFNVSPTAVIRWRASGLLLTARDGGSGHYEFYADEVHALLRGESRETARELALAQVARLSGERRA
jgi:DNA-binding transcriptional MerR regulator